MGKCKTIRSKNSISNIYCLENYNPNNGDEKYIAKYFNVYSLKVMKMDYALP